jgi:hypothetical protein
MDYFCITPKCRLSQSILIKDEHQLKIKRRKKRIAYEKMTFKGPFYISHCFPPSFNRYT